jgi:hypothetical protein
MVEFATNRNNGNIFHVVYFKIFTAVVISIYRNLEELFFRGHILNCVQQ